MTSTTTFLSSPTKMNLSSSLGDRLYRQPYKDILMWVIVAPKYTHQVSLSTKVKLIAEQTKVRNLPFFTRQVRYLDTLSSCVPISCRSRRKFLNLFLFLFLKRSFHNILSLLPFLVLIGRSQVSTLSLISL